MTEYKIEREERPAESAWGIIGKGLTEFNTQHAGQEHAKRLCYVVKTAEGEIAGGVIALVYWKWLCVDLLWLKEELRGQGYGGHLLEMVEAEGRKHGAQHVHLDTFSFQAPEFYKKYGYRVFGELAEFPEGHTRIYMTKEL